MSFSSSQRWHDPLHEAVKEGHGEGRVAVAGTAGHALGGERLAEAGIEPSVGSIGDSYDNAMAESLNGLFKAEMIHRRRSWKSFEHVELATLKWVTWFNTTRLFEPIGNIPPDNAT